MNFETGCSGREDQIAELFEATFAASESPEEGALIAGLVRDLMSMTPERDLFVFTAWDENGADLVGCIMFSRLVFEDDARVVFLLSPVAVRTERQRQGIGQRLLTHGLETLRADGVEIAVTYGDPGYYGQVGFAPVSEDKLPAPHPLSYPNGWLAQDLHAPDFDALAGPVRAVAAFDKAAYW